MLAGPYMTRRVAEEAYESRQGSAAGTDVNNGTQGQAAKQVLWCSGSALLVWARGTWAVLPPAEHLFFHVPGRQRSAGAYQRPAGASGK